MGDFGFVLHELRPLFELLAVGAISGTIVLFVLAPTFLTFTRTLFVGVAGVAFGWALWLTMDWPFGFIISGFPVFPSLVGTFAIALVGTAFVRLYDETMRARQERARRAAIAAAELTDSGPPRVWDSNQHLPAREDQDARTAAR